MQRAHRVDFFLAAQDAALEFEVVKAVTFMRGFGQAHDGLGCHGFFVAQARPGVLGFRLTRIRQVRFGFVADKKQVPQHLDRIALLAFAEQGSDRHFQVLAQQIQKGRLYGRHGMDGGAQIKSLKAAAAGITVGKLALHLLQDLLVRAYGLADHEVASVFQSLADFFAARHLTHAGAPGVVGEDQDVARKKWAVCAAEVQQHAVAAGDGDHAQGGDTGSGVHGHVGSLNQC